MEISPLLRQFRGYPDSILNTRMTDFFIPETVFTARNEMALLITFRLNLYLYKKS
jgi:hypothetical protein